MVLIWENNILAFYINTVLTTPDVTQSIIYQKLWIRTKIAPYNYTIVQLYSEHATHAFSETTGS